MTVWQNVLLTLGVVVLSHGLSWLRGRQKRAEQVPVDVVRLQDSIKDYERRVEEQCDRIKEQESSIKGLNDWISNLRERIRYLESKFNGTEWKKGA
jgi:peptidoglycan hydrolase CwlO-like protein